MRRAGVLLVLAGLTGLVVSGLVGGSRPAAAKGGLGSYSLTATAPGFEFTEDEPSAQAHPEGQGAVPETSTLLSAGPVCYALGTVAWPGSYGGNAGSLLQVLAPQQVTVPGGPSIPVPDAIQQAVYPNLSAANDPVRAEGRCGSAPDGKYDAPGTNLTAHADPARSDAVGAVNGAEQPAQKSSYGSTRSHSTSQLVNGGTAGVSDALSAASNVDIGGVIKIGSITSTAHATTDGTTAAAGGKTVVQNMTVAGQPAYVDDSGFHIGQLGQDPNPVVNQIADNALGGFGFKVYTSTPQLEKKGASASYTAGSLVITWVPPLNPSKNVFVWTFGGARVSVTSAPGAPAFSSATGSSFTPAPLAAATSPAPPAGSPAEAVAPGAPVTEATAAPGATTATPFFALASFHGARVSWLLLALIGTGLVAAGLRRTSDDILERAAVACPLER
ncbi:MAG: hypothetical protein E6G17_07870 [Actinobacteria bacterium]|nr:MAG: hypothetical protein E6G17_07870 [Actinomycetota bacterium]